VTRLVCIRLVNAEILQFSTILAKWQA